MHIRRSFYGISFQFFVIGDVGAEFVGYIANRKRRACRCRFTAAAFYGHIDNGTAGFLTQICFGIIAQVTFPGRIHLSVFQVTNIRVIVLAAGNIPVGHRHFACGLYLVRTRNETVVGIFQFGISQGSCAGKTGIRISNTQRHGGIHLGQGLLSGYFQILYTGIPAAQDTALHVIVYLADCRRNTRGNRPALIGRIGKRNIHTAGDLYVAVIGTVADIRTRTVGIYGLIVYHQGMQVAVHLVHGQAKGCANVGALALTVVGNSQP